MVATAATKTVEDSKEAKVVTLVADLVVTATHTMHLAQVCV